MTATSTIAAIRFGYGLSPRMAPPAGPEALLDALRGPDVMAARYPVDPLATALGQLSVYQDRVKAARAGGAAEKQARNDLKGEIGRSAARGFAAALARGMESPVGLRERLVQFWADHFTARARNGRLIGAQPAYVDEAIRPHVTGRFSDMLRAAETHPFMLTYLDQHMSAGPNAALKKRKAFGLNENLAREMLELHTLGVGAAYSQADVGQLALALTGLSYTADAGFGFRPDLAEPGSEEVLGRRYGHDPARIEDVFALLDDLAAHPDTARHLARKIAVHFVSDQPDPDLVAALTAAFLRGRGDLMAVYEVLLAHPAVWRAGFDKAKWPFDFLVSSLRALALDWDSVAAMKAKTMRLLIQAPLRAMGQPWAEPVGPDGWPEDADAWITPQGLAARIQWAMAAPDVLVRDLPDPRVFVRTALADAAPDLLVQAVARAETVSEGVGLVLSSPAFNRR